MQEVLFDNTVMSSRAQSRDLIPRGTAAHGASKRARKTSTGRFSIPSAAEG